MKAQGIMSVTIRTTQITIPTYGIGEPDKNPEFIEKRVYQGSTGKVYPYPVVETIGDEKKDQAWQAVILENEYLSVTVLPQLGGRIQYATDKTTGYDFVYHNDVIKPALVGLLGPWISGGIEFNWPQHHRPTTYMAVDFETEDLPDGGKAVLCHDVDQIHGTEVVNRIALHPGKAYIQITARTYNGTGLPQTFLWWANPAVPVNDHTRTIMPPDVNAVMDHGKRDVSRWPIATGTYYKYDYSRGVDISRYKNVLVPTSLMAAKSRYDFVGGYDFAQQEGLLHVADHHISPGKKQWTWGSGDFGRAWDRNLTDANGPYVELMTGVYTDNQPDFTWLKPDESKEFTQYFMPYKAVGNVKNATIDAAVNLEFGPEDPALAAGETEGVDGQGLSSGQARVTVYATSVHKQASVRVATASGDTLYDWTGEISPTATHQAVFETGAVTDHHQVTVTVSDGGHTLVSYTPDRPVIDKIPEPAKATKRPGDVRTNEELLLDGLHLEQYRHATYLPDPYYLEGLRRDPDDARINNAYGRLLIRRGQFAAAVPYLKRAIARLTRRNPNPYDSEAYFNLGLAESYLGRWDEAYDAFYKATWDEAQQSRAFFHAAAIETRRGNLTHALYLVRRGLVRNTEDVRARGLEAYLLRRLGRADEAATQVADNLAFDPFDFVSGFEALFAAGDKRVLGLCRTVTKNLLQTAARYASFGAYDEALRVLAYADASNDATTSQNPGNYLPMVHYYRADFLYRLGRDDEAWQEVRAGEAADPACCFPNKLESIGVLGTAMSLAAAHGGKLARAPYYLGCLFYDRLQHEQATALWEQSEQADPSFPTVHRNLALAYYNVSGRKDEALGQMEKAFALDPTDARVYLELDQLRRKLGWTYAQRLEEDERHPDVVAARDDMFIEYLTTLNMTGHYAKAYELMGSRRFHPWEGGEGKITRQYMISLRLLAKDAMAAGDWGRAKDLLTRSLTFPHNLGEGKLIISTDDDIHYYLGLINQRLGDTEEARRQFRLATIGPDQVAGAMYYNDQPAQMILFQGLAHLALGEEAPANARFYRLLDYGEQHLDDHVGYDYFAVSMPDFDIFTNDFTAMNHVHCQFLIGLANIGLGKKEEARKWFDKALSEDPSHIQANLFLDELDNRHTL